MQSLALLCHPRARAYLTDDLAGGMRSVAWTDCLQALLLLCSFFAMLGLAVSRSACPYAATATTLVHTLNLHLLRALSLTVLRLGVNKPRAVARFGGLPHAMAQTRLASPERTQTRSAEAVAQHVSSFVLMLSFALYPHQAVVTAPAQPPPSSRPTALFWPAHRRTAHATPHCAAAPPC